MTEVLLLLLSSGRPAGQGWSIGLRNIKIRNLHTELPIKRLLILDFLSSLAIGFLPIIDKKGHISPKMTHRLRDDPVFADSSDKFAPVDISSEN